MCCRSASVSADDRRVEQFPQSLRAEQLREQRRVERECLRAPLGEWRVSLVHETRRRTGRAGFLPNGLGVTVLHLDEADAARGQGSRSTSVRRRHVEHVLQALTDGLERDREPGELARRSLKQLRRPAAAAATVASGGPGCRLGSSSARRRRTRGNLEGEQRGTPPTSAVMMSADLLGVEQRDPRRAAARRSRATRMMIPSSVCSACTSIPPRSARGAWP